MKEMSKIKYNFYIKLHQVFFVNSKQHNAYKKENT